MNSQRKSTGSYYTPTVLVDHLLDTALTPVIDEAVGGSNDPAAQEEALLALTVCEPSCGSGIFAVSAGRRIAARLAAVRAGTRQPTHTELRRARRDTHLRCVYAVDVNPVAVDLTRLVISADVIGPGWGNPFLAHHIKRGNALLGATPKLLAGGLPDAAFTTLPGDDPATVKALRNRNRTEREAYLAGRTDRSAEPAQLDLFGGA